ncbi:hypothetical protein ILUMI_12449 [Ignelater luminosus]|uniref:Uncharacterized protein n=1 Tax=Ignelater luminosus TaxID=2038154 RepID=A0A8K0CU96_IGNLU|nr:hypothetical protein ILUMI_12449 [Ignelater luminosus]
MKLLLDKDNSSKGRISVKRKLTESNKNLTLSIRKNKKLTKSKSDSEKRDDVVNDNLWNTNDEEEPDNFKLGGSFIFPHKLDVAIITNNDIKIVLLKPKSFENKRFSKYFRFDVDLSDANVP